MFSRAVILAFQLVRQIDHEARIAARRAPADALRVEYRNAVAGPELPDLAGRSEAGEARADHRLVCVEPAFQPARRNRRRQDLVPARAAQVGGYALGGKRRSALGELEGPAGFRLAILLTLDGVDVGQPKRSLLRHGTLEDAPDQKLVIFIPAFKCE
jgi:hypothetical protein